MSTPSGAPLSFPTLLDAAEERSAVQQKVFYRVLGGQTIALALAAGTALLPVDSVGGLGPIVALLVFIGIIAVQVSGVADKAEKEWYEARAASESIKAASWEFSTGGEAFRLGDTASEERFRQLMGGLLEQLPRLDVPSASHANASVTASMTSLRRSSMEVRRAAYREGRVDDQLVWYSKKSKWNKGRAKRSRGILIGISTVAILLGILRIRGNIDIDLMSVMAALSSGVIVWMQAKKYTQLSEAYSVTSHEIALLSSTIDDERTEQEWAQFIHDAEAAFSREHTMWKARMQGPI
ncbi:DUF4231 domain-containing protein [Rhodococcus erythropolis]|uniref:DUF4231 domain-containing protein n=1 Tax=Rhodococcus erythropolis TaxID=1833 RepID=UPI000C1EEABA|nr:DUF4231 domain-containing protein [Rhodococcus erythropolis]